MTEKMMILMSNYRLGDQIRKMVDWNSIGVEIVAVEYNGAIGLEQFAFFKPRIVLIDSMVPIIGTDRFVDEMSEVNSDFLVILLDDSNTAISNIQNIYRVIPKSQLNEQELKNAIKEAIAALNKKTSPVENFGTDERMLLIQKTIGDGKISIAKLQQLRDTVGLELTTKVNILLPRSNGWVDGMYSASLMNMLRNLLNEYKGGEVFLMDDGVLCIMVNEINSSSTKERAYDNLLFDIRRILMKEYPVQWTFIFSEAIPLHKLEKEYASYRKLYEYGYFFGELQVLKKEYMIAKSLPIQKKPSLFYYNEIIHALVEENNDLYVTFNEIFEENLKKTLDIGALYQWRYALELINFSFRHLYQIGDFDLKDNIFGKKYYTIEEEEQAYYEYFLQLQSLIQKSDKKVNPLIYQIIAIMVNQYKKEEISLQAVASEINIAVTYLSHLLKKEMRVTFVEYLTMMRIAAAKRMLLNDRYKIHEVAVEAGFSDNRYFSRVFKKMTGTTPSEYKNKMLNENVGVDV